MKKFITFVMLVALTWSFSAFAQEEETSDLSGDWTITISGGRLVESDGGILYFPDVKISLSLELSWLGEETGNMVYHGEILGKIDSWVALSYQPNYESSWQMYLDIPLEVLGYGSWGPFRIELQIEMLNFPDEGKMIGVMKGRFIHFTEGIRDVEVLYTSIIEMHRPGEVLLNSIGRG